MYEYRCLVTRIVDGDTVELKVSLGFGMWFNTHVRLAGLNAPEMSTGEPGAKSKAMLADMLLEKPNVMVTTRKGREFEKYGRVLGTFTVEGVNINQRMLDEGYAVPMKG